MKNDSIKQETELEALFKTSFKGIRYKGDSFTLKETIWDKIQSQAEDVLESEVRQIKKRSLNAWYSISAAAVVLVGVPVLTILMNNVSIDSNDKTITAMLPDMSEIKLQPKSTFAYNKIMWHFRRNVSLQGEASFEVTKGKQFNVNLTNGIVSVLGTKFSVKENGEDIFVECTDGKVGVQYGANYTVVNKGEKVNCTPSEITKKPIIPANLTFDNTRMIDVVNTIKAELGLSFENIQKLDLSAKFTGSLPSQDIEKSLQILFGVMNLQYEIKGNTVTIK